MTENSFKLRRCQRAALTISVIAFMLLLTVVSSLAIEAKRELRPDGLILLHSERDNIPVVRISLLIKVSPVNEPVERAGLASITADLLLEGTASRSSEEISEEIDFIGADLGASIDTDYTTISLAVLKRDIEKGFELFSDILLNPVFPGTEIKRLKELTKGSLKLREEDPGFIAGRRFRERVFGDHPYGRLTEGTPETIDSITREDILGFYKEYYRPGNSILSVVGDISYDEINMMMQRYLSGWSDGAAIERPSYKSPEIREKSVITVDRDLTQANIILGHIGMERSNPDYYAVSVMNYILGSGGFASRLMNRIRDDLGLAYSIHSYFSSDLEKGVFQAEVQTRNESAKRVIDLMIKEIRRIQEEPVSDEELSDAKSFLTGSFPRRLDTMGKIANFLTLTEFYGLGMDYDRKYMGYINSITKEDVLRAAKEYLDPDRYVLVVVADIEKAGLTQIE